MFSILNRALSWAITSFGNKFCLKKRSRLIKALDNRFYVRFMQLEIGLLHASKHTSRKVIKFRHLLSCDTIEAFRPVFIFKCLEGLMPFIKIHFSCSIITSYHCRKLIFMSLQFNVGKTTKVKKVLRLRTII